MKRVPSEHRSVDVMLQLLYANWTGLNEAICDGNRVDNVLVVESSEAFATAAFPHANNPQQTSHAVRSFCRIYERIIG
jgi:hypothetical protein